MSPLVEWKCPHMSGEQESFCQPICLINAKRCPDPSFRKFSGPTFFFGPYVGIVVRIFFSNDVEIY